jgi:hypothetical protein
MKKIFEKFILLLTGAGIFITLAIYALIAMVVILFIAIAFRG